MLEALVPECRTEPLAAAVLEAGNAQYAAAIAGRLIELNALRPAVAEDTAADVLWFYVGQDAWFSLVSHRKWSFDDAERWLAAEARERGMHPVDRDVDGAHRRRCRGLGRRLARRGTGRRWAATWFPAAAAPWCAAHPAR
jgi:hypothetical protein